MSNDTDLYVSGEADADDWSRFVHAHPFGNIFQTEELYSVYKRTKNYDPIVLFLKSKDTDAIHGLASGVVINEANVPIRMIASRSIVQGGPLVLDGNNRISELSILLNEYTRRVKNRALYTQIENLYDNKYEFDAIPPYRREDHLNFLINLDQEEKEIWGQIHKDRRKNINRSVNKGVEIEVLEDREKLGEFYRLLVETYRTVKVPLSDISLFEAAYDILAKKGMAKFFLAKYEGRYIGARVVLTYKDFVYDWYAGAENKSLSLYPNEHLVWHILKWGRVAGYKWFDFGGAGKPDVPYGPREFKRRFGGELVNYGWYEGVHHPVMTSMTMQLFKVYQLLH